MPVEILRLAEAARRLGISTLELVHLVYERRIEFVLVDGVPRISEVVVEEWKRKAS